MASNEVKIAILEEKIDGVSNGIAEIKQSLSEHVTWEQAYHEDDLKQRNEDWVRINSKFDKLEHKLDKRYAPKWVEWATKSLIGAAIGASIASLIHFTK